MGKPSDNVIRSWLDLPTHHGGIHDMGIWYFGVNKKMCWVNVTMHIGILFLFMDNV
jgi:hypothetical protein